MIQHSQNAQLRNGRIIRMKQLVEKLSLSDSHIYALIQSGRFIKPFKISPQGRAMGWFENDVDAWLANQMESRDE